MTTSLQSLTKKLFQRLPLLVLVGWSVVAAQAWTTTTSSTVTLIVTSTVIRDLGLWALAIQRFSV